MPSVLFAALVGVVVEGSSTCPTPAAVEERLRALVPAGARADVARLTADGAGLRVTLLRADGSEAGSRAITGQHTCDELADAAAVVISTWQLDAAERERLPAPPPPAVVRVSTPSPWRWELGAGAGAGLSGAELAPAALVVASVAPGERLGVTARAQVSGNRPAALPDGSAAWRRALLAVGPRLPRRPPARRPGGRPGGWAAPGLDPRRRAPLGGPVRRLLARPQRHRPGARPALGHAAAPGAPADPGPVIWPVRFGGLAARKGHPTLEEVPCPAVPVFV